MASPLVSYEEGLVFIIGIDRHKGSHTAAVLDRTETVIGGQRVVADRRQRERLLRFAAARMTDEFVSSGAS